MDMARQARITPTPGYRYKPIVARIYPRSDYRSPTLHTKALLPTNPATSIEAEWCPVCLGRKISERMVAGRPKWHCDDCENEW